MYKKFRQLLYKYLRINWWEVHSFTFLATIPNDELDCSLLRQSKITRKWQVYGRHWADWSSPKWINVSDAYVARMVGKKLSGDKARKSNTVTKFS